MRPKGSGRSVKSADRLLHADVSLLNANPVLRRRRIAAVRREMSRRKQASPWFGLTSSMETAPAETER
jgi:hypothetical protein